MKNKTNKKKKQKTGKAGSEGMNLLNAFLCCGPGQRRVYRLQGGFLPEEKINTLHQPNAAKSWLWFWKFVSSTSRFGRIIVLDPGLGKCGESPAFISVIGCRTSVGGYPVTCSVVTSSNDKVKIIVNQLHCWGKVCNSATLSV